MKVPAIAALVAETRKQVAEEIAKAIEAHREDLVGPEYYGGLADAAVIAREVGNR